MNPFSYGTIVRGDSFFDRKEETKLLIDTLSGGNNVVLFAPRRYGSLSGDGTFRGTGNTLSLH